METEQDAQPSFKMDVADTGRLVLEENGAKRTVTERRLLLLSGVLVLLSVAFAIALAVLVGQTHENDVPDTRCESDQCNRSAGNETSNLCLSPECIRTANNLIRSMDSRVEPCDDFYQFACGRWAQDHMLALGDTSIDWFKEATAHLNRQIQDFLETNDTTTDTDSVKQAKKLYRSCLNTGKLDEQGLGPLLDAARHLSLGPSPVTAEARAQARVLPSARDAATPGWRLERALAGVQRALGHSVLLGVGAAADTRDRRRSRLSVSMPLVVLSLHGSPVDDTPLSSADDAWALTAGWPRRLPIDLSAAALRKEEYVSGVLEMAARWESGRQSGRAADTPRPQATRIARALAAFEKSLGLIKEGNQTVGRTGVTPDLMTVQDLQAELDKAAGGTFRVNLTLYLQLLFEGEPDVQLRLGADAGHDRDLLQVYDRKYLRALAPLLASLSDRTLQNYIWWEVVKHLAPYSNSELRLLTARYLKSLLGVHVNDVRQHFCGNLVNQLMGMAVGRHFFDAAALKGTRAQVEQMFEDIRWAFDARVDQLDWMDDATKAATRAKAAAMDVFVAFPDWMKDGAVLDEYYRGITVKEGTFLENVVDILHQRTALSLRRIREENTKDRIWKLRPPMQTNAIYIPIYNSMVVQAGFLQFPFFRLGLQALEYGAIGSIIGHELTHGFDANGRKYDKDGNILPWWSDNTSEEFENRARCFVRQYSQYDYIGLPKKVNGLRTLGENIADNGGVREAFHAFQRLKKRRGKEEAKLPGLERYSEEQLFFLSYANVWCGKWKKTLLTEILNQHSPKYVRVPGALVNSEEFTEAWKCPDGSGMNPFRERCAVW